MGKVLLCTGRRAVHPFLFSCSDIRIYTIEELCYYIYHHIEWTAEDLYRDDLAVFIREELGLLGRADFICGLQKKKAGLKDLVVSILCSADYYSEAEIKALLAEIDFIFRLNPMQRLKRSADTLLDAGCYAQAAKEYGKILGSGELGTLTSEECGHVLHNAAVLHAFSGLFAEAADLFLEAYERNQNKESLKQHLFALRLSSRDIQYENKLLRHIGTKSMYEEAAYAYQLAEESFAFTRESAVLKEIRRLKEEGRTEAVKTQLGAVLDELKAAYRNKYMERTIRNGTFFNKEEKTRQKECI